MRTPLNVLYLEDNPADVELCRRALRQAGFEPRIVHVDNERDFVEALPDGHDVILADYALPQFDAHAALRRARENGGDRPFIVVSGTVGEDIAVELIKQGADDYLLKDRLARLGAAIEQTREQRRLKAERRAFEDALRSQDRLFRAVIEHATEGLALLSRDLKLTYLSPTAERMVGMAMKDFPDLDPVAVVHPEDQARARQALRAALAAPETHQQVEVRMRRSDGTWRWVECTIDNRFEQLDVQAYVVNMRDVEGRRRAQEALSMSEANYRLLFSSNPQPMWVYDRATLAIRAVNLAAVESYGYSSSEFLQLSILDLRPPEDRQEVLKAIRDTLGPMRYPGVRTHVRRDGTRLQAEIVTHDLDFEGHPARLVMATDVTDRERARAALEASEHRQHEFLRNFRGIAYQVDLPTSSLELLHGMVHEITGYPAEAFLQGTVRWLDVVHPQDVPRFGELARRLASGEISSADSVYRIVRADGDVRWVRDVASVVSDAGAGTVLHGSFYDVTDQVRAEDALRESEGRYRALTENAAVGIYRTTADGQILFANPAALRMLGFESLAEPSQRNLEREGFEPSYPRSAFRERLERDGEIIGLESAWRRRDGTTIYVRENARMLRDENGAVIYEGTVEDITDRKRAEDELRRRSEEILLLYEAGRALGETLDLETLFDKAYQAVSRAMDCSGFYVSTFDADSQVIRCAYARHGEAKLDAASFPAISLEPEGQGTQSRVIRSGRSLYLPDYRAFWRTARTRFLVDRHGIADEPASDEADIDRSALIVPLKLEEKVTGVVQVFSQQPDAYRTDQLHFLEALAPQLAAAMANARLFRRAQEEIRERMQAEHAIRQLSEFNESIVRSMSEGIVLEGPDGTFSFVNPAAASMMGYRPEELLGKPFSFVMPEDQWETVREANRRRARGESDRYELRLLRKDGSTFPVLVSGSPRLVDGEFAGTIAVFTDISELKAAEEGQIRRAQELEALYQTSLEVTAQRDLPAMLRTIVERAVALLGVRAGDLYLPSRDGQFMERAVGVGLLDDGASRRQPVEDGLTGLVFRTGEIVEIEDYHSWPGRATAFAATPYRRAVGVPLKFGGKTLGVLNLADVSRAGHFPPEHIRLVELFADQAAIAIENARMLEAERGRIHELETLYQISLQINAQTDLAKLLNTVVEQARGLVGVDAAALALLQSDGETLKFVVAQGFGRHLIGSERRRGQGISGRVLESGRTMTVEDYAAWEGRSPGTEDSGRVVSVPLRVGGLTVGVLNLGDIRRRGAFEAQSIRLAELVADQAAIAVENARLLEETRRRAARLEGVASVSAALRAAADRSEMLPVITGQLTRILRTPHVGIALVASRDEVEMQSGEGLLKPMVGNRGPITEGLVGEILSTGRPFVTVDAATEPCVLEKDAFREARCIAGVPLVSQESRIGAVLVARAAPFEDEEVRLLTAVAEMAGNALHRAGVMETLEQRVDQRTADLAAANARLQELDQLKSAFVSNVSHELRSPITNILLYLDLINEPKREDRRATYMGILRGEAARLHRLIEDLLTLSRLERGAVTLEFEPQVLDALVAEVLATQEARAHVKHIELLHDPNPDMPLTPVARNPMVQVLTNLIGNAVAYAPSGATVTVQSRLEWTRGERYATVRVHNSAPAIPEEDLPHLFVRFYRGRSAAESGEAGTGLGLAICKEIVERHRGWIDVESAPETGTAFTVWLPVDPA